LDEKTIRGKIQQVGHRMDLHITNNNKVPYDAIKEFEFLIKEIRTRQITIDDTISWALTLYLIGKYQLQDEYNKASKASPNSLATFNEDDFMAVLKSRRSIRKWTSETVNTKEIELIIDSAKWAPSSCNRQLWQTLLINKQQDKEFLVEYFNNKFWLSAPLLILVLMDTAGYSKIDRHYAYLDGGAFIQNMLLTLHVRGYGACWIGFAKWDNLGNVYLDINQYERFYEHFKLKKQQVPISMIAVGKPNIMPKTPPRQDTNNIVIKTFLK
jgi:nitroreductase